MNDSDNNNNLYSGSLDPELADLMGISNDNTDAPPAYDALFGEGSEAKPDPQEPPEAFIVPENPFTDRPAPLFNDKTYYKKVLKGSGEAAQKLHGILGRFLNTEDPKEKSLYRNKIILLYWEVMENIAKGILSPMPEARQTAMRFGVLVPTLISREQRDLIARTLPENGTGEPFYYLDEWLKGIAEGQISPSATDEVKPRKQKNPDSLRPQIEKLRGKRDIVKGTLQTTQNALKAQQSQLKEACLRALDHPDHPVFTQFKDTLSAPQRQALAEMTQIIKQIQNYDKEMGRSFLELEKQEEMLTELEAKARALGEEFTVDTKTVQHEFRSLRQMIKMCVGRQGNHLPILMKQYLMTSERDLGCRENVIKIMAEIESIDGGLFKRTFKRQTNRIVPYVLLLPCYGDRGICWEPFEKFNRATSRGRVAIPLYPKNLHNAVVLTMGDLRWQVAKEKAQHYWMEEGLTGNYYQWFSDRKMKGDVKERFIQDYFLWITKEREGTQKLDREVRGIFWRYMPFPQEIKDKLRNRGFVYNELYKKDMNRALSDGY